MDSRHHPKLGVVCPSGSTRKLIPGTLPVGLAGKWVGLIKGGLSCPFVAVLEGCGRVGAWAEKPWAANGWGVMWDRAKQPGQGIPANVRSWRLGLVADNAVRPLRPALQLPVCPALARLLAEGKRPGMYFTGRPDSGRRAGPTQLLARPASFNSSPRPCLFQLPRIWPHQSKTASYIQSKNRFQPIKCADSGHVTVAGRCFGGALISMVFVAYLQGVWSAGGLAKSFLHYLTASGGCWDTGGLGSRLDSDLQLPG